MTSSQLRWRQDCHDVALLPGGLPRSGCQAHALSWVPGPALAAARRRRLPPISPPNALVPGAQESRSSTTTSRGSSPPAAGRSVMFLLTIGQRPGGSEAGGRREPGTAHPHLDVTGKRDASMNPEPRLTARDRSTGEFSAPSQNCLEIYLRQDDIRRATYVSACEYAPRRGRSRWASGLVDSSWACVQRSRIMPLVQRGGVSWTSPSCWRSRPCSCWAGW